MLLSIRHHTLWCIPFTVASAVAGCGKSPESHEVRSCVYEGQTYEDCQRVITRTLSGDLGPVVWQPLHAIDFGVRMGLLSATPNGWQVNTTAEWLARSKVGSAQDVKEPAIESTSEPYTVDASGLVHYEGKTYRQVGRWLVEESPNTSTADTSESDVVRKRREWLANHPKD